MTQIAQRKTLLVDEIVENEDGTATIYLEYDESFKKWFMESQNLKRWSRKRFKKVIRIAIENFTTAKKKSGALEGVIKDPEEEN